MTIRVHRDHAITVVRLRFIVSAIVGQISIQHIVSAVDVENTRVNMVISVGVAGQIQGINLQRITGTVTHIQNTVVGDVNGVCIQRSTTYTPASRYVVSNRYSTVVDRQSICCNMTIFVDVQCRTTGQANSVGDQGRITHVDDGTAVDAQGINQRRFGGIPL